MIRRIRAAHLRSAALSLALLLLGGCLFSQRPPDAFLGSVHQLEVPFIPGTGKRCGPASLTSVLHYWGVPVVPEEVDAAVFLPELEGTLPFDLTHFPRRWGLQSFAYLGGPEDLKRQLRLGRPVIAFLNLGNARFPAGHYVVVTGYSEDGRWLLAHSGGKRSTPIGAERFYSAWAKMAYWTLLILPKENHAPGESGGFDRLPRGPRPEAALLLGSAPADRRL